MFTIPVSHHGKSDFINQANFPALMHGFNANSVGGTDQTILTDVLGKITIPNVGGAGINGWQLITGATNPTWGVGFARNPDITIGNVTGTPESIGTKHALMIATGHLIWNATTFRFGNNTTVPAFGNTTTATSNTNVVKLDASNYATLVSPNISGTIKAVATRLTKSGSGVVTQFALATASGETSIDGTITGNVNQSWSAFTTSAIWVSLLDQLDNDTRLTGVYLFKFDASPSDSDIFAAMTWMHANPKKIWPGFYKRT